MNREVVNLSIDSVIYGSMSVPIYSKKQIKKYIQAISEFGTSYWIFCETFYMVSDFIICNNTSKAFKKGMGSACQVFSMIVTTAYTQTQIWPKIYIPTIKNLNSLLVLFITC